MAYEDFEDYSEKVNDTDYYNVIIPDLDPGTNIPVQFRWQYSDRSFGGWSAGKVLEVPKLERAESTNIIAIWEGTNLKISWEAPPLSSNFTIYLTSGARTVPYGHLIDKSTTAQFLIISAQTLMGNFEGVLPTVLTGLLKTVYIDTSTTGQSFTIPPYDDAGSGAFIADADWVVTQVDDGYSVSWTKPSYATYLNTSLYKSNAIDGTYSLVRTASEVINVIEANTVFVKIQHNYITGSKSAFSNAKEAKKYVAVVFDHIPPNETTIDSVAWSVDDILINYTMPATDPPVRFRVELYNGIYTGIFEEYRPTSSTGSSTIKILDDAIFQQFGTRYSSYTGKVISIDAGENKTTGATFAVPTRANQLLGVVPTFVLTAITNGYAATWPTVPGYLYAKVYESGTSGFTPGPTNLVYSGISPAIIKKTAYTTRYVVIQYLSKNSGDVSSFSAQQSVTPIDAIAADVNPPDAPATVGTPTFGIDNAGTLGFNGFINLSWTAVSDSTLRGYRIRFRPATTPASNYSYENSPGSGTTYRLSGLSIGATYEIAIASYDEFNNTTSIYKSFTDTLISGTPSLSNYITSGASGFQFGSGIKNSSGVQDATAQGIYLSNSNYWYLTGANAAQFKIGGSSNNYVSWNGTKLSVDGDLGVAGGTTIGGNIAMGTSGSSIYQGTLSSGNLASDGFLLNSSGLVIKKGTVQLRLDTSDGGIYAEYGQIAGWTVSKNKIESGTSGSIVGLANTGTYALYAGATSADNSNAAANFSVTRTGQVVAKKISIIGDGLTTKIIDAGANFYITNAGFLYAANAEIKGTITASAGDITGQLNVGSSANTNGKLQISGTGGTILMGQGVTIAGQPTYGITATSSPVNGSVVQFSVNGTTGALFSQLGAIGGWTIGASTLVGGNLTLSNTGAITNSSETFSVSAAGKLIASGVEVTGTLRATDGYIGTAVAGWQIDGDIIKSAGTSGAGSIIKLNSQTGTISGGLISGSKVIIASGTKTTTLSDNASISLVDTGSEWYSSGAVTINTKSSNFYGVEDISLSLGGNSIQLSRSGPAGLYGGVNYPAFSAQSFISHADELSGVSRGDLLINSSNGIVLKPKNGTLFNGTVVVHGKINAIGGITAGSFISGSLSYTANVIRNITVNSTSPSGGAEGDIWIQI